MTCKVLVADPPWRFGDRLPGAGRGAAKHYQVMPVADICRFPMPDFDPVGSLLFMWRVSSMQREALDVVEAWGFTVKSELVWRKVTAARKRFFGMGRYVRMEHEICLIAKRGKIDIHDHATRSVFDAAVSIHSKKPDEFFKIVETLTGPPTPATHVELFSRVPRPGWRCYGNELAESHPITAGVGNGGAAFA